MNLFISHLWLFEPNKKKLRTEFLRLCFASIAEISKKKLPKILSLSHPYNQFFTTIHCSIFFLLLEKSLLNFLWHSCFKEPIEKYTMCRAF